MTDIFDRVIEQQQRAASLAAVIKHHGACRPVHECFYETFNGSIVFICDPQHGQKPRNYIEQEQADYSDMIVVMGGATDETPTVMATVLSGGHKLHNARGGMPPQIYYLNYEGLPHATVDELLRLPEILGMTLKRRIAHITDMEALCKTI